MVDYFLHYFDILFSSPQGDYKIRNEGVFELCKNYKNFFQKQTQETIKGLLLKVLMTCHLAMLVWSTIAFIRSFIEFYSPAAVTDIPQMYCSETGLLVITVLTCLLGIGLLVLLQMKSYKTTF